MSKFILSPGPTQCDPKFLETMSKPVVYHRCSDFHKLYESTRNNLRKVFNLHGGEILLLTSSGTGAMEASVQNFFSPQDHVLVISVGHFGNRFIEICKTNNLNVDSLVYPIGKSYDYEEVKNFIQENPDLKGVFITHHETSSGVLNKLQPVGELVAQLDDCVFIVDSVSGLLAHPMDMDRWHIDCCVAASQKGFNIPPGLAVAALSDKAISRLDKAQCPTYYFDFRKYIEYIDIEETPFTPSCPLVVAINKSCDYLVNEYGLEKYYQHHYELRKYLEEKLRDRGFDVDSIAEEDKGNVLVAVTVKPEWNAKDIHDALDEKDYIIATGFGDLKPKMMRIAVIGDISKEDIDKFLVAFDQTIEELYH